MRTYNEKMSIYHGMASAVATNTSNSYIPIFAMTILGATNYQVGLISSLPPLITLLMTLPAAILLNRAIEQKRLVAFSVLAARFVFLLIAFISYVPGNFGSWLLLGLIAAMSIPNTMVNMGWQSFIGNLIDEHRRAQFFSDRNRLLTIVGLIVTLIIGVVMKDTTASTMTYQILFTFTFLVGIVELYFLMKHEEPVRAVAQDKKRAMDWSIFKNNQYVLFLVIALVFNFGWQMAWGLFNIYNIRYAGATIFWVSMFNVGSMVTQILSFSLWRKWSQKYGNMRVFIWVAFGMSTAPLLTVLSTNHYYLVAMNVLSGFFISGTVLILFNLLLENSPQEVRTYCITSYNVLLAIIAFSSPQIGIWLLETYSMNTSMYVSTTMRFLAAIGFLLLYSIRKKRATAV
ncbi:MFS transporter [Lysinibacillus sp. 2017]|uniref:MFS transporter n=1 Tax=unclassified Lysinibacillus TaxID=2636778 RepID=UPI000D528D79|nr:MULTISPECIES: MFS transporter [unclassified Lysinibacillus]AWE05953.1 MFS transporter [Lysinibacillus sp. 2017]TGN33446.1 MFS transporter [Lysinibacillus sp. S2017]